MSGKAVGYLDPSFLAFCDIGYNVIVEFFYQPKYFLQLNLHFVQAVLLFYEDKLLVPILYSLP